MHTRRTFIQAALAAPFAFAQSERPNILLAISDDQSWMHTGASGDPAVRTPAFDRVARSGVRFLNAISASPGCAPSRAALLTGRMPWQLEEAGTHASHFPKKFQVYPGLLASAGYHTGLTGKGGGPANFKGSGWTHNPAGPDFQSKELEPPSKGISNNDYAANFQAFLEARKPGQPFCFWYGGREPHRVYEKGSGLKSGKKLSDAAVPPILPDTPEIRSDILDYYLEIEHFDRHLGRMLDLLEKSGEFENTIVAVTSDNGMPFPSAKATMREYGIHMPLAISWPKRVKPGRTVEPVVSLADLAPTFLEAAAVRDAPPMTGKSLLPVLTGGGELSGDSYALSGRERHSHSRADNLGYPSRAIRTGSHLYIRNFAPDRWPAGDPEKFHDIDASPSKTVVLQMRSTRHFNVAVAKNPEEELYDVRKDPGCLQNLAESPEYAAVKKRLRTMLERDLEKQRDPRILGSGDVFESYPRFSPMRPELGGFAEEGEYNPKYRRK